MSESPGFVQTKMFGIISLLLQIVFIVIFGVFGEYGSKASGNLHSLATNHSEMSAFTKMKLISGFSMFQDVQGMIFLGFGFLMTFLRKYSFSSVGFNMYISALAIQWALIINGLKHPHEGKISIDMGSLLGAEFSAAAVLISFGAILGKTTPLQLLILALLEIPIIAGNEYIGREIFKAIDMGDTMFVHAFGAYFGLFCSRVIYKKSMGESPNEGAMYHSDVFAMVGTLILWIFWPSFNSAGATGVEQHRAIVNTICALLACTVTTFALSSLVGKGKFNMVHIQNATLAGGVAVGASADLIIGIWGAMVIGTVAGTISTLGYQYITPRLNKLGFHDTCGVNNLHGMPALLGGIACAVASGLASFESYGYSLYSIFPRRVKTGETLGESALGQALFQLAALGLTLLLAALGGSLTGGLIRIPFLELQVPGERSIKGDHHFDDEHFWLLEEEEGSIVEEHHHKHNLIEMTEQGLLQNDNELHPV